MSLARWIDQHGTQLVLFAAMIGILIGLSGSCTPAQDATFDKVVQIVEADLKNGAVLEAIESDIAAYVPQGQDVDLVIDDVINYLHDIGAIAPGVLPTALAIQTKIATRKSGQK